jgi:hypothetical protein
MQMEIETPEVLSKASVQAAQRLDVSGSVLSKILGISPEKVTLLQAGNYLLNQKGKEWEFALLFVRMFHSLQSIVGNEHAAREWIKSFNRGLNGKPLELITQAQGLVTVVHYLDASRV